MKKMQCMLLVSMITIFANASDGTFNLSVSTDGRLILQSAQLINANGYEKTITGTSGEYVFTNNIARYGMYTLSVVYINPASKKKSGTNVQLFLKPGDTKLRFVQTDGEYIVTGASASAQTQFEALASKDQVYLKKVMAYETKARAYQESGNKKATAAMNDSLSSAKKARRKEVYESYILEHPNDEVSMYAMKIYCAISSEEPLEVKSLLSTLSTELQETDEMIEIRNDAEENEKFIKGVKAPDFTQTDTSGTPVTLSSLQGKYVLVDFWASWCKPCRAQNPSLVSLFQKYKDKGFTILGVSLDSKRESWLNAIHADKLEWQHVSDLKFWRNDVARQYKISHVPQNYLLDSQGVIVGKNLSEDELEEILGKELR